MSCSNYATMKTNECTRIIGKNVILVPYTEKHVPRYHDWMKSPELQHLTASEPLSLEEEYKMQKQWHEDKDKCTFIILDRNVFQSTGSETDAMIGDTNLFFNDPYNERSAEIEIMIADVKNRGMKRGWEATILMLLYGINILGVNNYQAKITIDNEKSIRMFRKLQFQEVEKSNIFKQVTLQKEISYDWIDWLTSQTCNATQDDLYRRV